ncbi:DUF4145 domain-containing protein [Methylobacterium oryzihabitans]|uniref:DUF4145 domain-containing protein n=1 Tax=Methylobacterium oryzihabitans TaxID=2499852 RepID=A0A3S2WCE2_9HYPH|nr:DUF4145 domain-containing protein [Methylobacterium oryzihabitans]RVU19124.1 DUF4145 domain-containing protein [Methylobacterium oryzihabitans]
MTQHTLAGSLQLPRCPHCQIANPLLNRFWQPSFTNRSDGQNQDIWAAFSCSSCGSVVTARCYPEYGQDPVIVSIYPDARYAHADIPPIARKFLQQAYETIYAPDAAAVMAGSAVDAMLKELNYTEGSVYKRIEQAVKDHVLTEDMGEWAHSVRLGSNRPRHVDAENPHVSPEEAKRSVNFAEALGQFLFVLKAQIARGLAEAQASS